MVLLISAAAFALSEITIRLRGLAHRLRNGAHRMDRSSIIAIIAGFGSGAVVAAWSAATGVGAVRADGIVLLGSGITLMWLGILLRQWAVWALGRFFTVVVAVSDQQPVVTRGPYRWVRHPSYSGLLLTAVGWGLASENWVALLALAVLPLLGVIARIRVEEHALITTLDEPYRAYASAHRWRLVPGVW